MALIIKMMKGRCGSCTGPSQLRCKHRGLLCDSMHWGGPCKAWSWGETRGRHNSTFKPHSELKIDQRCVCVCVWTVQKITKTETRGTSDITCMMNGREDTGKLTQASL